MWCNRMPFGKRVVNKYGSVCYYYQSFCHGTLHMWARIDEEHTVIKKKKSWLLKHEKNNPTLSNDWPTYCQTRIDYMFTDIFYFTKLIIWCNVKLAYPYNKLFNPVNLVFLLLSIQSIRHYILPYFCKTINVWFQFILITFIITEW
jgi:hypothetical protein